ncbi:hypothetical protein BGZ83_004380 [Gryganskiella cystojenkinii]|nr:hypothetical protein BGZ83_004380 [Gryganskiella cystojenkinii]
MKLVLSAIVATATILVVAQTNKIAKRQAPVVHWDYGADPAGESHWGLLDPAYITCDSGLHQSPIDINKAVLGTIVTCAKTAMVFDYQPIKGSVVHWNGHAVEVDWTPNALTHNNSITIGTKKFNLIQFHFHTPSEHRINNRHADAELHLVHRNPDDNALAVIGVLLRARPNNVPLFSFIPQLSKKVQAAFSSDSDDMMPMEEEESEIPSDVDAQNKEGTDDDEDEDEDEGGADFESQEIDWDQDDYESTQRLFERSQTPEVSPSGIADDFTTDNNGGKSEDLICTGGRPTNEGATSVDLKLKPVDFAPLLRVVGKFSPRWEYSGSLTTPPCSENVAWNVMHNVFPIGLDQLHALVDLQGFNARDLHQDAPVA